MHLSRQATDTSGREASFLFLLSVTGLRLPVLVLLAHKATASGWHARQLYEDLRICWTLA